MADITLGKAYVQIVPSAQGISGSIQDTLNPEATSAGNAAGQKVGDTLKGSLSQRLGKGLIKSGAVATAISAPLIMGIKKSMEAYKVQSAAETKLTEIYKTRMGVGKKAAQSTMDVASALQKQGIIGDEVALSGSQQLATFAKYPSTINTLMPAMENLLAQQKGVNATAEDATNIGNLMGKVLQGQTGALKRVGVSFDENQEKILKYGTEEEKAAVLAQVITDNVGNMNSEMAKTPEGKIQQMKNAMGDLSEKLGASLAPALASIANWLSEHLIPKIDKLLSFMKNNPLIGKIIVGITALLAVGGPLMLLIGGIMTALPAITGALGVILGPVGLIIAGIAALTAGLVYAYKHSETFRKAIQTAGGIIKEYAISAFAQLKAAAITVAGALKKVWGVIGPYLIPIIKKLVSLIPTLTIVAIRLIKIAFTPLKITIKAVVAGVKLAIAIFKALKIAFSTIGAAAGSLIHKIKSAGSQVYNALAKPFVTAKNTISGAIQKIRSWFPIKISNFLGKIKLPHFKLTGSFSLKKKTVPHLDVDWYAKGGILDSPTIIGAGEAGREGIIPLEGRYMRPFANAIAGEMHTGGNTINIYATVNGTENSPEEFADRLVRKLEINLRTI